MSQMPSLRDHERRITALEDRAAEVERTHGDTIYTMKRRLTGVDITLRNLAQHFNTRVATEEDIDEALDQE